MPDPAIVLLVPGFPATERELDCLPAVQNYVAALAARRPDLDVHVVAFQYPFARQIYPWNAATVHALGGANRRWPGRGATWARAVRTMASLHRLRPISVVHSFWLGECTLVGQWAARWLGCRHVASVAGQDARPGNPYLRLLNLKRFVLTAGSRFAANHFAAATDRTVDAVIPLGLDVQRLQRLNLTPPEPRPLDVIGVGSLTALKDFQIFLHVIDRARGTLHGIRSLIVGDGPERGALQATIDAWGLSPHVRLAGALPRDEVLHRLHESRVFLHPSRYEAQGYAFLEARFAGLPIVCREVGAPGDDGYVFRCATADEMTEAVLRAHALGPSTLPLHVPADIDTVRQFELIYGC